MPQVPSSHRRGLGRGCRIARALLSTQYATMVEYRAEIALWALSGVLPLIMLGVWQGSGAGAAAEWSAQSLSRYFMAVFLVRQFTVVWLIHVFEEDLLQGRLSPQLLQPLHPLWRHLAAHVAEQATRLPFVALMLALAALLQASALPHPTVLQLLLALLAIAASFVLRFCLQIILAMACFWSERAAALDRLLLIPYLFLSGLVAPLDTFPPGLRAFATATPFPLMVDFPARLLAGLPVATATGFVAIAAWCAVLLPIGLLLWRVGLRHYSAMGA